MTLALAAAAVLAVTAIGVEGARRWALHQFILDHPNERSSHSTPTPRGGGIAIVVVVLAVMVAVADRRFLPVAGGALLIAVVGFVDDLRGLSARVRFAIHVLGAAIAIAALGYVRGIDIPAIGHLPFGVLGIPLTLLWIVGLTNAFNFMDGIDGIAGGQGVVAGLGYFLAGRLFHLETVALIGGALAMACLGFLFHNWQPARIFMGDVASGFLGYLLAVLALPNAVLPFAAALFLWPFLFDSGFTILRRLRRRENIFAAHRTHLYQRLVISGLRHAQVSALYIALALLGIGVFAAAERTKNPWPYALIPIAALCLWTGTAARERRVSAACNR